MSLDELIEKFLEKTGFLNDKKVQAIVVYGSRVRGNSKASSDLDVLVITDYRRNYKCGMKIENVTVDYNVFSIDDLFDIAYDKRLSNNAYFESILNSGKVIKNNGILEELNAYLDELKMIKPRKKKLSLEVIAEIKELYDNFVVTKSKYWYFNLLERLRMAYNYLYNCSYLSMVKVYNIFSNSDYYQDAYKIKLPDEKFISLFLEGVTTTDFDLQMNIINFIIVQLKIDITSDVDYVDDELDFVNDDDIKNELLIIYNKVEKIIELLRENHPYADYAYNVLLNHIDSFYQKVYRAHSLKIDEAIRNANNISNEYRIIVLKELFGIVDKDYHFDYDNYMLKLKL